MQGERDANGGGQPAYKDALNLLISKLRRDLELPDMNIVIGRLSDAGQKKPSWGAMQKIQMEIVDEDPSGAWVGVDDLNDREKDGKVSNAVHYNRPEGYIFSGSVLLGRAMRLSREKSPQKTADLSCKRIQI